MICREQEETPASFGRRIYRLIFALAGAPLGLALSTNVLFLLFIPWTLRLGARLR